MKLLEAVFWNDGSGNISYRFVRAYEVEMQRPYTCYLAVSSTTPDIVGVITVG